MTLLNRKTTPANAWPGLIRHPASADTLKVMDSGRWRAPTAHGPVRATLRLPGSKSITNRALILAALSDSPSVVRGVLKATRPLRAPAGHAFESYDDHRMVMAGAVLGLGVPGIEVLNVATVGKTFPDFTTRWEELVRGDDS